VVRSGIKFHGAEEHLGIQGTVTVRLKEGVLDPEGQTIRRALDQMGIDGVESVRTARLFEIRLEAADAVSARARLEEISAKLLTNPVVETFAVEVNE
jgi:phosphoribosylformylglycinamidine synthase PurS subunit